VVLGLRYIRCIFGWLYGIEIAGGNGGSAWESNPCMKLIFINDSGIIKNPVCGTFR
jgi:hypothetical protein